MKISTVLIASAGIIFANSGLAGSMGPVTAPMAKVLTLSIGPAWSTAGESQTLFLAPGLQKTYTANNETGALAFGELFYGYRSQLSSMLWGQLGIAAAVTSDAHLSGDIWDDALPAFDNFTYTYHVNHARVALKGKLLAGMGQVVTPYVSASVGLGFNRAHGFSNTPRIFEAVTNPNLTGQTKTSFAYTAGVGVEHALTQTMRVGVGYEFADWGMSQLGSAFGQTMGRGLARNHLFTNGLAFSASYLG